MAWQGTKTWAVGDLLSAADLNAYVRDNTAFLHDAPSVSAYSSVNVALATGTYTPVTLNSERRDTSGFHSTSSNTSRFTIPAGLAGMYGMTACVEFSSTGAGTKREVGIRLNGVTFIALQTMAAVTSCRVTTTRIYPLVAGDYVEMLGSHDVGIPDAATAASNYSPEFSMQWLAS